MKLSSASLRTALRHLSYGDHIRPARDWFTLLAAAVFLVAVSLVWNLWLLRSVEQGGVIGTEAAPETFDAAPIKSVQGVFEVRKAEELRFKREYRFVDPQLSGS